MRITPWLFAAVLVVPGTGPMSVSAQSPLRASLEAPWSPSIPTQLRPYRPEIGATQRKAMRIGVGVGMAVGIIAGVVWALPGDCQGECEIPGIRFLAVPFWAAGGALAGLGVGFIVGGIIDDQDGSSRSYVGVSLTIPRAP